MITSKCVVVVFFHAYAGIAFRFFLNFEQKCTLHSGLNQNERYLMHICCSNGFHALNIFFQRTEIHKYTWYRPCMDQKSFVDFCIVSSDLLFDVLNVRVEQAVELPTDPHLVACS